MVRQRAFFTESGGKGFRVLQTEPLTRAAKQRIARWARTRCADLSFTDRGFSGVLLVPVEHKAFRQCLLHLMRSWGVSRVRYSKEWLQVMDVDAYSTIVGPSAELRASATSFVDSVISASLERLDRKRKRAEEEAEQHRALGASEARMKRACRDFAQCRVEEARKEAHEGEQRRARIRARYAEMGVPICPLDLRQHSAQAAEEQRALDCELREYERSVMSMEDSR
jgi:hypothetical protein